MRDNQYQLCLFNWADNRPTAVILDARPRIEKRVMDYMIGMAMSGQFPDRDAKAEIVLIGRGAA